VNNERVLYSWARVIGETFPDDKLGEPAVTLSPPRLPTLIPPEAPTRPLSNSRCKAIINCVTVVKRSWG